VINTAWLTLNRFCNFRCPWCYARGVGYSKHDDMSFELAENLVYFLKSLQVSSIILAGGEPAYYSRLFDLIKLINSQGLRSILATNGYRFKDMSFLERVENSGLSGIDISIKASNKDQQLKLTGVDVFEDVKRAITNLSRIKNVSVSYSVVMSKYIIENIEEVASLIETLDKPNNKRILRYSLCTPTIGKDSKIYSDFLPSYPNLVNAVLTKFDSINNCFSGKVIIEQSSPLCLWPKEFIENLKKNEQIAFGCHIQSRSGLVLDKDGKVIMCNVLPEFPIGQYGVDFNNRAEFEEFWMSNRLVTLYDKIYEYPSTKCMVCNDYLECGGGCPLKWLAYNTKEVL
jgi:radical SAM additional 4Fe4S-binding domain